MTKDIIIITLLLLVFYLYYQQKKQSKFLTSESSGRTLFSFEEEQLKEQNQELKSNLDQALALQEANKTKMTEQTQEISNLKTRLNDYEGVGASSSGEDGKL